jgi:hypothetical protein
LLLNRLFLLLALTLGLAACGELPRPFQPETKGDDNPLLVLKDRAGVVIRPVEGLPPDSSQALTEALSLALQAQGIVATTGAGNAASLTLSGIAWKEADGYLVTLVLTEPKGAPMRSVVAHLGNQASTETKAWAGYATAMAKSVATAFESEGTNPANTAKPRIMIGAVTGVPGDGGRALERSLGFTLRRNTIEVTDSAADATHLVVGTVRIAPPRGPAGNEIQNILVQWTVTRADKSEVGQLRQANDVPARMVDRDWAQIALAVAEAAAEDIAQLVIRAPSAQR